MVDHKMLRVRLTQADQKDLLLLQGHWRLSQSDVVRRAMREAGERVLVEIDTMRAAKARSDRMERLAARPVKKPIIPMSADRAAPWESPKGSVPGGYARRCKCRTWRLITVAACPSCGDEDGYELRDVSPAWMKALQDGLENEAAIEYVLTAGGRS